MAKATTIKDAVKKLEEARGINAAEAEKVCTATPPTHTPLEAIAKLAIPHALSTAQIELYGQCPPIEKMDATLSTLKACKCVRRLPTVCVVVSAQARHLACAPARGAQAACPAQRCALPILFVARKHGMQMAR
jgi:hypothetical protein